MIDTTKFRPITTKELLTLLVRSESRYRELVAALGLDPAVTEHPDTVAVLKALMALLDSDRTFSQ